ncbi:hypothetical protein KY325_01615, partial [Candidatus Woesearchaeota archaeon]|nr:hypothetical protein [Candidatus Woesearchaeota archaeon]
NDEEMKKLGKTLLEPTEEELEYWNNFCDLHQKVPKDTLVMAGFFKGLLEDVRKIFTNPEKVWLLRRIIFEYAKRLERYATFKMEDADPRVRSDIMLTAADLYQEADELIGFATDNTFRQMESVGGAIHFRRLAGLEDEIKQLGLDTRVGYLVRVAFGDSAVYPIHADDPALAELRKKTHQVADGAVKIYVPEGLEKRVDDSS